MTWIVAFIVAVPLSIELLGALYAIFDVQRDTDARAAAVERLALPLLLWGTLWWLLGIEAWRLLIAALAFTLLCHVTWFFAAQWLIRRESLQTIAVDTESERL
jgi:hypothetical protein